MAKDDQNLHLLLVEDNNDDEVLTVRAIKKAGVEHRIDVARDGQEALDYFKKTNLQNLPELILLDLKLPKVNGLDVLKHLKSDAHLKSIPVVILTTSKEEQDMVEAYNLGVNSYVVKPVDVSEFTSAIHKLGTYWFDVNQSPARGQR